MVNLSAIYKSGSSRMIYAEKKLGCLELVQQDVRVRKKKRTTKTNAC